MKIPEIVLYINDVICSAESIELKKSALPNLFKPSGMQTQYSFAIQKRICCVQSQDIFGTRKIISKPRHLSPICDMYLVCNGNRWRTILNVPECPRVTPVFSLTDPDPIFSIEYKIIYSSDIERRSNKR